MTDKRELIVRNTIELLNQQGYAGLTISQIARASGIGKGTVYEYFNSKEELILQSIADYAKTQCRAICAPLPQASMADAIHALVLRLCDLFENKMAFFSVFLGLLQQGAPEELMQRATREIITPLKEEYVAFVEGLCAQAVRRGELPAPPDGFTISYISVGLASYVSMQFHPGMQLSLSREAMATRCTQMVLRQLGLSEEVF